MKFLGIIPARYASTRFPAKPLAMLGGKTVIQRVYEQVAGVLDDAYVATDDERIEAAVKAFGGKVVMTSVHHKSGTDRCYEACTKIGGEFDVVVNIQAVSYTHLVYDWGLEDYRMLIMLLIYSLLYT